MTTSLIISIYKNITDLKVVLDALNMQTEKNFNIIISEDGNDPKVAEFINSYNSPFKILHIFQSDVGWRKNQALNRAITLAKADYLIFIDGDCVLHHQFIENHIRLAEPNGIVAGKRIKLGIKFSQKLREISLLQFEKGIFWRVPALLKDNSKFVEEGIYINPKGFFNFIAKNRKMKWLKGCNFSCFKSALLAINGFDEDYQKPAIGEDIDITWRFKGLGYNLISARNYAVQYHLHHKENWTSQEENIAIMNEKQGRKAYICSNGIIKSK